MPSLRPLFSRSRTWLAVCAATIACNSIFDIQDPVERAPGGTSCLLNSNCPEGEVCLFKVCSPPCEADIDCSGAGSRCLHTDDGTACVNEAQAECGDDETRCPSGTVCSDDACYAECNGASRCPDGHDCLNGVCRGTPPSNTGGTSGEGGTPAAGGTLGEPGGTAAGSGEAGQGHAGEGVGGAGAGGEGGEGPVDICTPNERSCQDNSVKTCNDDGTAYLMPLENCGAKQTCVLGNCEDQECTPGADFCSGKSVRTCADNGLSSSERTTCSASQYCDVTSATCKDGVCAPDQPACNGNTATSCNSSGSGYTAGGTTCKADETCDAGTCKPHVCTPGATYCQGQDVKKCAPNGLSSTVDSTCDANKTCVDSGASASCAGVCGPGQTNCSGNGVQSCNASGQWGAVTACKTTETCASGRCTSCSGGLLNCDDNAVNGCETDPRSTSSCGTTCANVLVCSTQNGTASCTGGSCGISCSPGFGDCGGTNNGCETNTATEPNHCGACGKSCSSSHMATRTCSASVCNGACATGYANCDNNKQTNGCETATDADPNNCGDCNVVCKYRSCVSGACNFSTWGNDQLTSGPTTTKLGKNTLWTFKINVAPLGAATTLLQSLGIVVVVDGVNPVANIRMGLYTDSASAPNALEAQTPAFVTADGVSEKLLSGAVSIPTGAHWIAFLADQDVRVHVDSATTSWASAPVSYASVSSLPATFPLPSGFTIGRGHLFAITTP